MKQNFKFLLLVGIVLGIVGLASAQVNVWMPDTTALPGATISVPLYMSGVTTAMNVTWYDFQVDYNSAVAVASTINFTGTITPSSWWATFNVTTLGSVLAGAYGLTPPTLSGNGPLAYIEFTIPAAATGSTGLTFSHFQYGYPQTILTGVDGSITIGGGTPGEIENLVIDVSGSNIVLTWGAVPNATSYNVYRGTTAYFTPTTVYQTVTGTTYTDTGAVSSSPKYYIVTAVN